MQLCLSVKDLAAIKDLWIAAENRNLETLSIAKTCLSIGEHRGVTKTYNRIKHKYYWENLKSDVQCYIRQCLQCQLKKLVQVKIK